MTTIEETTQNNDHNHESLDHMEEMIQDSSNNYESLDHEEDIAEENSHAGSSQTLSDDERQQLNDNIKAKWKFIICSMKTNT